MKHEREQNLEHHREEENKESHRFTGFVTLQGCKQSSDVASMLQQKVSCWKQPSADWTTLQLH